MGWKIDALHHRASDVDATTSDTVNARRITLRVLRPTRPLDNDQNLGVIEMNRRLELTLHFQSMLCWCP